VLYLVYQLELEEAYLTDVIWDDALERLPDGSIMLVPEIWKAVQGEPFSYFPEGETKKSVSVPGVQKDVFYQYVDFFNRCEELGLPHGAGWMNELPWVSVFLMRMKQCKSRIEQWHIEGKK